MKKSSIKLCVVIPVHNEEATLEQIVKKVSDIKLEKKIIIVDDCSTDASPRIEDKLATKYSNVKVIRHEVNKGKGGALQTGFQFASGDYVIIQDADLEYDPKDYFPIIEKALEYKQAGEKVVVYGSRFLGKNAKSMSTSHYWGNKMLTIITNLLFGAKVTDMETCYKLIPVDIVKKLNIESTRFNVEPEITAKLSKMGIKIVEVPISYDARAHEEGKHISWRDGKSAVTTLFKYRFKKL